MAQVPVGLPEMSAEDEAVVFAFYGSLEKAQEVHVWLESAVNQLQQAACEHLGLQPIQFLAGLQATVAYHLDVIQNKVVFVDVPDTNEQES